MISDHVHTVGKVLLLVTMAAMACVSVFHARVMVTDFGLAWDAYAYYQAWHGEVYDAAPGYWGAYNYSPTFIQLLYPLTLLPWPVFAGLSMAAAALGLAWLAKGMRPLPATLLLMICSVQVLSGNIDWLIAVTVVVGMRHAGAWVVPALTKVTPTLGPVWFAARGEWRHLYGFLATLGLVVTISALVSPNLWIGWVEFLVNHSDTSPGMTSVLTPPLWARLAIGLALTVAAARLNRPWWLPVAMLVAVPVPGTGPWALLAAIPRLRRDALVSSVRPVASLPRPTAEGHR